MTSNNSGDSVPSSKRDLRTALANFVTGVTVVTTLDPHGSPRGLTANSFTSVSLDPPLILVCIANTSLTLAAFDQCSGFTVNILSEDQRHLCAGFAARTPDKFSGVAWSLGKTGAPRLHGSLVSFDCSVHSRVPAGDHVILIGRVDGHDVLPGRPLVYGQGGFIPLGIQQDAVSRPAGRKVIVGCIAETHGRILLQRHRDKWVLPQAPLIDRGEEDQVPLKQVFLGLGIEVEITFLYSVFESAPSRMVHIIYRGELRGEPIPRFDGKLFDEADLPWQDLEPVQLNGMLKRFFRERAVDQFGIYSEFAEQGRVAKLTYTENFDSYLSQLQKP